MRSAKASSRHCWRRGGRWTRLAFFLGGRSATLLGVLACRAARRRRRARPQTSHGTVPGQPLRHIGGKPTATPTRIIDARTADSLAVMRTQRRAGKMFHGAKATRRALKGVVSAIGSTVVGPNAFNRDIPLFFQSRGNLIRARLKISTQLLPTVRNTRTYTQSNTIKKRGKIKNNYPT